jgi:hypothetical protein
LRLWTGKGEYIPAMRRREQKLSEIPVCPGCGVKCSICRSLKHGGVKRNPVVCCLQTAPDTGNPETYPDTGETGDSYNLDMEAQKTRYRELGGYHRGEYQN